MKIKEGETVVVRHCRKGKFEAVAIRDFDTEEEEWYPVAVSKGGHVEGMREDWVEGEEIPCRATLCTVEKKEG